MTPRNPALPTALRTAAAALAAFMAACVAGSGGNGPDLAEGHYFLVGRFDSNYAYEQFFVVQPDNRYEWVEYGYNASNSQVCKVTRQAGTYDLGESRLALVREKEAGPVVKCGFTASDFRAMRWTDSRDDAPMDFEIRNVGDQGFEAKAFFDTGGTFKSLERKADPYGFYD